MEPILGSLISGNSHLSGTIFWPSDSYRVVRWKAALRVRPGECRPENSNRLAMREPKRKGIGGYDYSIYFLEICICPRMLYIVEALSVTYDATIVVEHSNGGLPKNI